MVKKITVLIMIFILMVTSVYADVIGHIYKTDIKAYENCMQIPSYNCGGTTVVFVRDLENYGYDVWWDETEGKVHINKNPAYEWSPIPPVYEGDEPAGTILYDIYSTNIKTYFEGKEITSFNIGGKTAIIFRDLDTYGNMSFDANKGRASFYSKSMSVSYEKKKHIEYMYKILECMSKLDYALEKADLSAKNAKCDKKAIERVKTAHEDFLKLKKEFQDYEEPSGMSESTMEIWWSAVNLDIAAKFLIEHRDNYSGTDRGVLEQYMLDSYIQRNNGLMLLVSEL